DLLVIGRRLGIHVPALHAKAVFQFLDRHRLGLVGIFLGAAERIGVHEGEMRKVAEIVDDQEPVGLVVHVAGLPPPFGIGQRRIIKDELWIGLLGIAGPDEDQIVFFDHGIAAHAELGRNDVLAGNLDALAVG